MKDNEETLINQTEEVLINLKEEPKIKIEFTDQRTQNVVDKLPITKKFSKNAVSFLSFVKDNIPYLFQQNERYHKWVEQPEYLKVYNEVPEHSSSINFILNNLIVDSLPEIDYWSLQKLCLDYLIYGGFTQEVQKLRGGSYKLNYLDMGKCRLSPKLDKMGYSENWLKYNVDIKWKPIVENVKEDGIFFFKNNKSREKYPTPYYYAALKSLDTMTLISEYHNNNAKYGFAPNVVINFNNGEPDDEVKEEIEKRMLEKFSGASGQKIVLSFNESEATKTTIEKLDNDNLDTKFSTLQKFIQDQIIISHQITSGQLIGVRGDNQGFSQTEYESAMYIFENVVISSFRRELEYALSKLLDRKVELKKNDVLPPVDPNAQKINKTDGNSLPNINQNA